MDQTIIMKQPVKSDEKWENAPHMMAARDLIVFLLLFFPGQALLSGLALLFFSDFMPVISVVRWIYQLLLVVGLIWIVVKKNKECNLTKSTAFIKRGSTLYMIEMGYYTTKDMYLEEGAVQEQKTKRSMIFPALNKPNGYESPMQQKTECVEFRHTPFLTGEIILRIPRPWFRGSH